uniref:DRBM domain-containing protein n=1 Tax=Astyanax mexicanus TaxID=7994 RepID=A0A8B9KJG1_ASTMX
ETSRTLTWSDAPKNALVQLNELRPGLQYRTVSQTGPVHAPLFSIAVEVNGLTFEGTGPTKKKAKMQAAELALRSLVGWIIEDYKFRTTLPTGQS